MNIQEKREKIREIREKCHTEIFEMLCQCPCADRKILKQPNVSRLHPAGKVVIVAPTKLEAESLRDNCQNIVSRTNNDITMILEGKEDPYYFVKYKITLHHAYDKILLSMSEAVSRKKLSGKEVTEFFTEQLQELQQCEKDVSEEVFAIQNGLPKIQPEGIYMLAKHTGTSYRLTYYDSIEHKRTQRNVGQVAIIYGDERTVIEEHPLRKKRSDSVVPIFSAELPVWGHTYVYIPQR